MRGPCTPSVRIISRSPVRLGPEIHVKALGKSAVGDASERVGQRRHQAGDAQHAHVGWRHEAGGAGVNRARRRGAIAAGSATAMRAPVMPTSTSARRADHVVVVGHQDVADPRVAEAGHEVRYPDDLRCTPRSRRRHALPFDHDLARGAGLHSGRGRRTRSASQLFDELLDHRCSCRPACTERLGRGHAGGLASRVHRRSTRVAGVRRAEARRARPRLGSRARRRPCPCPHLPAQTQFGEHPWYRPSRAQVHDHVGERDLDRARVVARATERGAERQVGPFGAPREQRRQHLAHRPAEYTASYACPLTCR